MGRIDAHHFHHPVNLGVCGPQKRREDVTLFVGGAGVLREVEAIEECAQLIIAGDNHCLCGPSGRCFKLDIAFSWCKADSVNHGCQTQQRLVQSVLSV